MTVLEFICNCREILQGGPLAFPSSHFPYLSENRRFVQVLLATFITVDEAETVDEASATRHSREILRQLQANSSTDV